MIEKGYSIFWDKKKSSEKFLYAILLILQESFNTSEMF